VIAKKHAAFRLTRKAKKLAAQQLDNWHEERNMGRIAQDKFAEQEKTAKQLELILEEYRSQLESTNKNKRELQKEWADEETQKRHGGKWWWPPWVVQIICEMLVNGTSPSAVPSAMQTMYEMLIGEPPKELPSVSYVRSCRVVVEVIGETIATMKLADAPSWSQLWTDGTTRRQIPFTALVVGLMGNNDDIIDPVVVSSCIFMEDERSETAADGILKRVSLHIVECIFLCCNIY
jgi:hypothetical protein